MKQIILAALFGLLSFGADAQCRGGRGSYGYSNNYGYHHGPRWNHRHIGYGGGPARNDRRDYGRERGYGDNGYRRSDNRNYGNGNNGYGQQNGGGYNNRNNNSGGYNGHRR